MKLDYASLRKGGASPRLHPNGFVQLDLGNHKRLHIWPETPLIPGVRKEPIHDHTFSFDSEVLLGSLTNIVYELIEDESGNFQLYTVKPFLAVGKESPLIKLDDRKYYLSVSERITVEAGHSYHFDAFRFHDSEPHGLTASIMSYSEVDSSKTARVLREIGQLPPEIFDRNQIDSEILWQEIENACRLIS